MKLLGLVTGLFLTMVLVSYFNARADFLGPARDMVYFDSFVKWLPHSYYKSETGDWFWRVFGLAGIFWATRDWLLCPTRRDGMARKAERLSRGWDEGASPPYVPSRLRLLLWVLTLNAAALAVEGFLQRVAASENLLFFFTPRKGRTVEGMFGPWSYRSSAAQYFNQIWPLCIGFWACLQARISSRDPSRAAYWEGSQVLIIPAGVVVSAAALMSGSRAGAAVFGLILVLVLLLLTLGGRGSGLSRSMRRGASILTAGAALVGVIAGGSFLWRRYQGMERMSKPGMTIGAGDMTLVLRFRVPENSSTQAVDLVAVGPLRPARAWYPGALHVDITESGILSAMVTGERPDKKAWIAVPEFRRQFGGKVVDLIVLRDRQLQLWVEGRRLAAKEQTNNASAAGWRVFLRSDWVAIQHHEVVGVALGNQAASEELLKSRKPLDLLRASGDAEVAGQNPGMAGSGTAISGESPGGDPVRWHLASSELDGASRLLGSDLSGRKEIWATARKMAVDYPWWGSGLGSFGRMYGIYRSPRAYWAAYAHDDWLETRVTVGRLGYGLVVAALLALLWEGLRLNRGRSGPGIPVLPVLPRLALVGLVGCLVHAKFDLPFQIYSVTLLFVVLAAVATSLKKAGSASGPERG